MSHRLSFSEYKPITALRLTRVLSSPVFWFAPEAGCLSVVSATGFPNPNGSLLLAKRGEIRVSTSVLRSIKLIEGKIEAGNRGLTQLNRHRHEQCHRI